MVLPPQGDVVLVCTDHPTNDGPAHLTVLDLKNGQERGQFEVPDCHRPQPQILADGSVFLRNDGPESDSSHSTVELACRSTEPYAELPDRWNARVCADGLVLTTTDNELQLIEPENIRAWSPASPCQRNSTPRRWPLAPMDAPP